MRRFRWLGVMLWVVGCAEGVPPPEESGGPPAPARLTHVRGKVLVKRSNGDDWIGAVEAMDLRENDKIRTSAGGSAIVQFATGGTVAVGEDALVAIAETRTRPGLERSDLTVIHGQVNAELPDAKHQSLSVTTPSATVRAGREIVFQ